ncbi:MAG: TcfC E-set like domain-containing protein [Endozoicomonas sp.]
MRRWICKGTVVVAFSISVEGYTTEPLFLAASAPPPGFEDLSRPQQTQVDIYFGNRYLTSQLVTFSPGIIELASPGQVARMIGNLNDPALITEALSGEISTNPDQICPPQSSRDCGVLSPAIAGVIFDEARFRVDVYINRRFMLTRAAEVRKYLPPSDAGFAMMQNLSGAVSGNSSANSTSDYTINGLTMAAWEENSLYWSWDYSQSNHFSVNQLYGQRDFEGLEYNLGLLSSSGFGLSFTPDQPMVGGRITTSSRTREDSSFTGGMPLEVFLPVRGRVEIRKDGRLIDSGFFEAGAQQLDTSRFPSGAYDIEVRVVDEQGNELSSESRFFAKQYQLPPLGEWLFFAESGRVMTREGNAALPETTSQWINRAGASRRLMDTLSGTAAIANVGDQSLVEVGLFNLGYSYELSPSFMWSADGDQGISLNARTNLGRFSVSGNYRRLWADDDGVSNTLNDGPRLLGGAFEQHAASVSAPLLGGSLSYRYSFNQSENNSPTRTNSLDYRRSLFRTFDYDVGMSVSLSQSGDTRIGLLSFNLRYRKDRWNFRASPRAEIRESSSESNKTERIRLSASWDDGDLLSGKLRVNGGLEAGSGDDRLDSSIQYANRYGRGSLNVNHTTGVESSTTSWGGSLSTSFLTDGNVIAMGGEQRAESAVVINLDGRQGDIFDVRVNGQRRGYAVAGKPSVIPLSPFDSYRVSLSPAGETLYSFDERDKNVTLYPGNVVILDYEAVPLQLLFGRFLFNGEPLDGARINGGLYPGNTDDIGMFQLETRTDIEQLQIELDNGWVCQLPVDSLQEGYVLRMGTVELEEADCSPLLDGQLAVTKRLGGS